MFIYNITIKVDNQIHESWLQWLHNSYISFAMNSGCFSKYQLVKLLHVNDEEGPTYALQFYAESKANYNRYIENYLRQNEAAGAEKWGNRMVSFSTLMQVVSSD